MDPSEWGFMPMNLHNNTVFCVLCGAHGWGQATHDREGERRSLLGYLLVMVSPYGDPLYFGAAWQRQCWAPHPFMCACGKAFPKTQALGAHVAGNRRWRNPGHGSMERVGYGA